MSDIWKYFPCQMGDDPASIFFDYGIHDTVDQLPTQLLRVHVPFKQPREDGMPTNAEADALFAIEDALQELVVERKAYYVGRVTVGGQRHFQIYTPGSKDDWVPGLRDIGNRFGYQLSFELDLDPEHNGYRKDLYPTDDDWQVIADIGVLESLAKHGDDASAMHTIEHFAYFPSEAITTEFSNWLEDVGYAVSRPSSNPDGQFCVEFTHQGTVRLPDISSHSIKLRRQAKKMGGDYDGWEHWCVSRAIDVHHIDLAIRSYRHADAPALWDVFFAAVHELACRDYSAEQLAAWAPVEHDAEQWARRMDGIQPFVAERDGRIVGYADVQADGYIDHFFVAPAAARSGVGTALMRRIHERAAELGLTRLYNDVSITARPFFERFGFVVEAEQTVAVRGVTMKNFRMAKHDLLQPESR